MTRPRPQLLALGVAMRVAGADTEVVRRAGTDDRPILRLRGFDGREAAEAASLVSGLAWRGIRGYPRTDEHR